MTNKTSAPIRFCLVGAGRIAQTYIAALADFPDGELTAVVEPREAVGRSIAEDCGCRFFTSFADEQICELIDAVIICAPPKYHAEVVEHFLARGKHVLCEKPLTLASTMAERLVQRAAQQERVLMMASKFRYVGDVVKAKALVESGILGEVVFYENSFCAKVPMKDRWNALPDVAGGGVLIDAGSHSVDIFRYLAGPVRQVFAARGKALQRLEVEDNVRLLLRNGGGTDGVVDLSWSLNKNTDAYISMYGTEGSLVLGWSGSSYRQDGSPGWVPFGSGYDKLQAFRAQLDNLVCTIRKTQVPLISPHDALASVQVIEAAYRSLKAGTWEAVEGQA